ncbi:MBL fold metallo-hydrolase [Dactylosporangium sp. AC04546]|uniref:MBL fold metallo-hydrolase n=1 Tax=Dactylosporangium sp. AC04546 TaxID=2862460 RepID=UPI001EDE7BFA|nr:MBL fold metallo-hydrolase [Dactylosporangium sp. AC04546]WVK85661.1 MBL fold metallo-hydrolase [Dactylosporangium sp. AC04546]
MTHLREIASNVHILRHKVLDVTAALIVGTESALVVDTLSTTAQARELLGAVRRVTDLPLAVVNTHHHFDHTFGNAVFTPAPIWGHEETAVLLGPHHGEPMRAECQRAYPDLAAELGEVPLTPPTNLIRTAHDLDLGDRLVELRHFGRGHSAGDLVVLVPDADVVIAGDLVEESGPPQFDDAYPLEWPDTLAALLPHLEPTTQVVPGHGRPVDRVFVHAQHEQLASLAWLIREGDQDGAPPDRVAAKSPFPQDLSLIAVHRGYLHLNQS